MVSTRSMYILILYVRIRLYLRSISLLTKTFSNVATASSQEWKRRQL